MIYLLHFDKPLAHARHYIGFSNNLDARLEHHRNGTGARITQVLRERGITFTLAATWKGERQDERRLHRRGKTAICPICTAKPRRPRNLSAQQNPGR